MSEIKKQGDYYEVVLGRLPKDISDSVFADLKKRAHLGTLRCEFGMPKRGSRGSFEEYAQRLRVIDENKVCASIVDVERAADGKSIIGHVRTTGPYGQRLNELINENGHGKISFGVRGFVNNEGQLSDVVTYDVVPE